MAALRHLEVGQRNEVTTVRFMDRKILDEQNIQEMGRELIDLVDTPPKKKKLLLNFTSVEFLSSGALGQLIKLERKVRDEGGQLKLCHIRREILEVFAITKLNKLFDIRENEADALAAF